MTASAAAPPETATKKERNEILVCLLKEHYSGLIDFEFKHGGVLALIMGWLLSSDTARKTISNEQIAAWGICGTVLMLTFFHALWVWRFYQRSEAVYKTIDNLGYIIISDVESRRIPRFTILSFILFHFITSICICTLAIRLAIGGIST